MKTGKPTRLSEKLNAELDTIRQDYAASMASQLKSFRTDLNSIATNAQRTIETDTLGAVSMVRDGFQFDRSTCSNQVEMSRLCAEGSKA